MTPLEVLMQLLDLETLVQGISFDIDADLNHVCKATGIRGCRCPVCHGN